MSVKSFRKADKFFNKLEVQTSDPQTSDSTKHGLTNLGLVQTLDLYKRRTGTNVRLRQTSD